jgi:hypothetical protein
MIKSSGPLFVEEGTCSLLARSAAQIDDVRFHTCFFLALCVTRARERAESCAADCERCAIRRSIVPSAVRHRAIRAMR